jgi:hypothetical protein
MVKGNYWYNLIFSNLYQLTLYMLFVAVNSKIQPWINIS